LPDGKEKCKTEKAAIGFIVRLYEQKTHVSGLTGVQGYGGF
jgi:hypothetical protein